MLATVGLALIDVGKRPTGRQATNGDPGSPYIGQPSTLAQGWPKSGKPTFLFIHQSWLLSGHACTVPTGPCLGFKMLFSWALEMQSVYLIW